MLFLENLDKIKNPQKRWHFVWYIRGIINLKKVRHLFIVLFASILQLENKCNLKSIIIINHNLTHLNSNWINVTFIAWKYILQVYSPRVVYLPRVLFKAKTKVVCYFTGNFHKLFSRVMANNYLMHDFTFFIVILSIKRIKSN